GCGREYRAACRPEPRAYSIIRKRFRQFSEPSCRFPRVRRAMILDSLVNVVVTITGNFRERILTPCPLLLGPRKESRCHVSRAPLVPGTCLRRPPAPPPPPPPSAPSPLPPPPPPPR